MKKVLLIATALVILGAIVFAIAMTGINWNFEELSTVKMQTKEYEFSQEFDDISIKSDTADIVFVPSDDGKCKVVCYEETKTTHTVSIENGALTVTAKNEKKLMDYIGISFSSPKITVYLPASEYKELKIENGTGDISLPGDFKFNAIDIKVSTGDVECMASARDITRIKTSTGNLSLASLDTGDLNLTVSSGKVNISDVECNGDISLTVSTAKSKLTNVRSDSLTTVGNTGDIEFCNVVVSKTLSVTRTTGDVKLKNLDAGEIKIVTNTGDVVGTLRSEKIFITKTSTGKVDVPKTAKGAICEITTSTGDIEIDIKGE